MPWFTPTLRRVREMTRDDITASLRGAAFVGNNVLRVMSDTMAGLAHLTLRYIDWLALQLLPDTAEKEWLDRHGAIWLKNADGSVGRKPALFASGTASVVGAPGSVIPQFAGLQNANGILYEITEETVIDVTGEALVHLRSLTAGAEGNIEPGFDLFWTVQPPGVEGGATIVEMAGGTDQETDAALRTRVLLRIQQPPMGGAAHDYVQWALAVNDVTRAWSFPNEMGIGTVTVRFMMDEARGDDLVINEDGSGTGGGFPTADDIEAVTGYLDTVRPVCVKDRFVEAPLPFPIDLMITNLVSDTPLVRAAIETSIVTMLFLKAKPGQTIYRSWVDEALSGTNGVDHYDLEFEDTEMPWPGYMAVLGAITYG